MFRIKLLIFTCNILERSGEFDPENGNLGSDELLRGDELDARQRGEHHVQHHDRVRLLIQLQTKSIQSRKTTLDYCNAIDF